MVFFLFGALEFDKVKRVVGRLISNIVPSGRDIAIPQLAETPSPILGTHIEERGTHQAHVMVGRAAYGSKDKKRIALYFLNNILGGPGMNSRLNIALREHRSTP